MVGCTFCRLLNTDHPQQTGEKLCRESVGGTVLGPHICGSSMGSRFWLLSPYVLYAFQIGKLRSELEMVSGNVRVMSEMLTELVPTQIEPTDLELLQVSTQPAYRVSPTQLTPYTSTPISSLPTLQSFGFSGSSEAIENFTKRNLGFASDENSDLNCAAFQPEQNSPSFSPSMWLL